MGEGLPNRYAKAWRDILAAGAPSFHRRRRVLQARPFLAAPALLRRGSGADTRAAGGQRAGFCPDVFEYVSEPSPDLGTAGEQQTEFVLTCSKASGHNLLDFFTKWGFLTPVDASIDGATALAG